MPECRRGIPRPRGPGPRPADIGQSHDPLGRRAVAAVRGELPDHSGVTSDRDGAARQREAFGLYGPRSEAWRLNREAMLLLGAGPRALLLQLAHPAVAAGVDEHSDFRADPWARLQATLRSYLTIVYGTTTAARAEIRRLNELHRTISGAGLRRPRPRALAVGPRDAGRHDDRRLRRLDRAAARAPSARATTTRRCRSVGRSACPPTACRPTSTRSRRTSRRCSRPDGHVQVSPVARELAWHVLNPPLGPVLPALAGLPPAAYAWTLWPSIGLLPASVRADYGFRWGPLGAGRLCVARRRVAVLAAARCRRASARCPRRSPPIAALGAQFLSPRSRIPG